MKHVNVLVVGAGPTGLTLAAQLLQAGMTVRLIDRAVQQPPDHSRAMVLHARTLELYERFGMVQAAREQGVSYRGFNIVTPDGYRRHVELDVLKTLQTPFPMMLGLPQHKTEALLSERLTRLGGQAERGVELTSYTQDATLVTAQLRYADNTAEGMTADWLVGCDGSKSAVREAAGIAFEGDTYDELCMVGDITVQWSLPDAELYVMAHPDGIVAAFPHLGPGNFRVVVVRPHSAIATSRALTQGEFEAHLKELVPIPFQITAARFMSNYRLHHRVAAQFRKGRVLLAGDAAHVHSPVGGQGMNTGIQDAFNLAWKLAAVSMHGAPPWVLDTYDSERRRVATRLVKFTDGFFGMLASKTLLGRIVRRVLPRVAPLALRFGNIQRKGLGFMSQLHIRYRHSPLSCDGAPGTLRAGDRAPDATVHNTHSQADVRLFQLFADGVYTLLIFADATDTLVKALEALPQHYGDVLHNVVVARTRALAQGYVDSSGQAYAAYDVREPAAFLIRPDGYVAVARADAAAIEREVAHRLGTAHHERRNNSDMLLDGMSARSTNVIP